MSSTIPDEPYNCAIHSAGCKNIKCPGRKLTKKISDEVEKVVIEDPRSLISELTANGKIDYSSSVREPWLMGFDPGKDCELPKGYDLPNDFKLPPRTPELLEKPSNHYGDGSKMELIDLINAEGDLVTFAKWNAIKYILRHDRKNGKEDLEKAQVYLNWLKEQYQ